MIFSGVILTCCLKTGCFSNSLFDALIYSLFPRSQTQLYRKRSTDKTQITQPVHGYINMLKKRVIIKYGSSLIEKSRTASSPTHNTPEHTARNEK